MASQILQEELFALCPSDIFKDQIAEPMKTIEAISDINEFKSIKQIIEEASQSYNQIVTSKSYYKMKMEKKKQLCKYVYHAY